MWGVTPPEIPQRPPSETLGSRPGSGLIALADEPDPWGVLLERIEQEQARMMARHRWND